MIQINRYIKDALPPDVRKKSEGAADGGEEAAGERLLLCLRPGAPGLEKSIYTIRTKTIDNTFLQKAIPLPHLAVSKW